MQRETPKVEVHYEQDIRKRRCEEGILYVYLLKGGLELQIFSHSSVMQV